MEILVPRKILNTYFSQIGNTEKIGRAIGEVATQNDETEIMSSLLRTFAD
ncbi:MAG: hypothetical protein GY866_41980 [Proteobacteria bacterium]|nr:hypothetical protein [Pseudomonadota bacterium]